MVTIALLFFTLVILGMLCSSAALFTLSGLCVRQMGQPVKKE